MDIQQGDITLQRGSRVIGYGRVSTNDQADNTSLAWQREKVEEHCSRRGYSLIAWFHDVETGSTMERPGWEAALQFVPNVDGIMALRLDRVGRTTKGILECLDHLEGIQRALEVIELPLSPFTSVGRLVFTIMAGVAELERKMIYERTSAGRLAKQKEGGYSGGSPPVGYRAHKGELVPVAIEQAVINLAKKLRQQGRSLREIASELCRRGFETKRGGKWHPSIVSKILKREKPDERS